VRHGSTGTLACAHVVPMQLPPDSSRRHRLRLAVYESSKRAEQQRPSCGCMCPCVCVCALTRVCVFLCVCLCSCVSVCCACLCLSQCVCVCVHVRMLVAVYDSMHLCQVHDCLNMHDNLTSRRCTIQLERVPCSSAGRSRVQPAELVRVRRQQLQPLPAGHVRDACRRRLRGRGGHHGETVLPVPGCVG
jgi:hypothetical protein